jgi:tRNA A-37 threonylcarbamoyl transferase component Bud32
MIDLLESVRKHCPDLPPALMERHFQSLPVTYFERYAPAEIGRHLRLIALLAEERPVALELRPFAAQTLEAVVAGFDHPGALSCIAAALAARGFSLEDVQVSTYLDSGSADADPRFFIVVLRVGGPAGGPPLSETTRGMQDCLAVSFAHLAKGELVEAQVAAVDLGNAPAELKRYTPSRVAQGSASTAASYEGRVLGGDFRLERKLASGGMSEVYLATQLSLKRTVAVKLFRHNGQANDESLVRFNRESLTLAQFSCPAIVQVLAAGADEALNWMAMEYLAGGDLGGWIEKHGAPTPERGFHWFRQALEGLQYAHRRGVLHRDLKPHNLLLNDEGDVKVSDFGLLKQVQPAAAMLTPHAAILGTPYYMAPEQALGESVDERSDIFSLGATFFHLFTGQLPFNRDTATAVLVQIAHEDAPRLTDAAPEAPAALAVVIGRMMARRREERYQEVGVILEDLASYERRGLLSGAGFSPALATPATHSGAQTKVHSPSSLAAQYADS